MHNQKGFSPSVRRLAGRHDVQLAGLGLAFELVLAAPAMAAEVAAAPDATAGQPPAASQPTIVGDLIVTAQRREERMQSIPAAISAVTAATLAQSNITSAKDIGKVVPGTLIQETVGTATVFVRGVGSNQLGYGNSPSDAIYIDGVYQTRVSPVMLLLNSVDRVEVLKGPQGTLFGRNSESGLIQIITRAPTVGASPHMEAEVGYANYSTINGNLYLSSGLGDKVAADISLLYQNQQDGFGHNSFLNDSTYKGHDFAARTKWVFQPSDHTKFILNAYYNHSQDDRSLFGYYFGNGAPPRLNPIGSLNLSPPTGFFDRTNGAPEYLNSTYYGGSLRATQELPFADLVSISAIGRIKEHNVDDADFNPIDFLHDENQAYDRTFTQELQLVSKASSPVEWVGGLFYMDEDYGYSSQILTGASVIPIPGAAVLGPAGGNTKSYAVYGQATFPIVDKLFLTLGGRYSVDDQSAFGEVDIDIPGVGVIPVQPFGRSSTRSKQPLWKETLEYKFDADKLIYFTNSRGAKAGAYNLVTFDPVPIKPETLDAYEVGFKTQFYDRRLRMNGALFYYDIQNPQVFQTNSLGTPVLVNAGAARVKGAEFEAEGAVTPDLTLRAAITYLDATYTRYDNAPFYAANPDLTVGGYLPSVPGNAAGNQLSRAPHVTAQVGGLYRLHTSWGEFDLSSDYSYTSKFYWDADNGVRQPAYGVWDARISYLFRDSGVRLTVWGANLNNARYYVAENQFGNAMGSEGFPAPPRQFGVTLGVKF